jgi:general secretion pathway protein B
MSFILDALRKSENERQRQASPHVSVTATGGKHGRRPGWLALVVTGLGAALLAVAAAWWLLQPSLTPTQTATPTGIPNNENTRQDNPAVRNLDQEARLSLADTGDTKSVLEPVGAAGSTAQQSAEAAEPAPRGDQPLTVIEAMAAGLSLPHMNLDIHVFAPQPAGRFVFVNARKYREGETLREGPRLEEITSDGVILTFQGQRLLLPRD